MTTATESIRIEPGQNRNPANGKATADDFYFHNPLGALPYPDHTQLPDEDGTFVKNFQEHPQSMLLTDSIKPVLARLHPDGQYAIGQDCGIYWRWTDPPLDGAEAPDWFYVPDVPPTLDGIMRRSYVMWREVLSPLIVVEFVSGKGDEEKDRTPYKGKFWIYEKAIRPLYYAIYYGFDQGRIELYRWEAGQYLPVPANAHQRYPIAELQVALGTWQGYYLNATLPWLRWWDADGHLLPTSEERAEQEHRRAEQERLRAEEANRRAAQAEQQVAYERQRVEELLALLRSHGIDQGASN